MYNLTDKDVELLLTILQKHLKHAEVWVFGSRHKGNNKPYSDIDLAIVKDSGEKQENMEVIKEDLMASDISIRVDLHDYNGLSASFRAIIDADHSILLKVT